MDETVTEQVEKNEGDGRLDKNRPSDYRGKTKPEPTAQQRSYLAMLSKTVGIKMDVSKIKDREQASRLIDNLKLLRSSMSGNGYNNDLRDKKVAFGLATKLIYRKWVDLHHIPGKSKRFWKEVTELFEEYAKHQEGALCSFCDASELAAST